ncbi:hypothetical protein ACXYUI_31070, partial [Klebsiella pneumoniae]
ADLYLGNRSDLWLTIDPAAAAFSALPADLSLAAGTSQTLSLTKSPGAGALAVYLPDNRADFKATGADAQQVLIMPGW